MVTWPRQSIGKLDLSNLIGGHLHANGQQAYCQFPGEKKTTKQSFSQPYPEIGCASLQK